MNLFTKFANIKHQNMKFRFALLLIFSIIAQYSFAQLNLPTRTIGNEEYYYRIVERKESIYDIVQDLGISKETIIKYNPYVTSGIKKGQCLYFPVSKFNTEKAVADTIQLTYTVRKGENAYRIAKNHGVKLSDLIDANPNIINGVRDGQVLVIPGKTTVSTNNGSIKYTVKKGETVYRVAKEHNISIVELTKANPGISPSNFKAGMIINIPTHKESAEKESAETIFVAEKVKKGDTFEDIAAKHNVSTEEVMSANPDSNELKKGDYVYVPISPEATEGTDSTLVEGEDQRTPINITLLLPVHSEKAHQSKKAKIYADFYRGFLLAINEYVNNDYNITINAIDISDKGFKSVEREILTASSDVIVNCSDDYIHETDSLGYAHNIKVINALNLKNKDYCKYSNVYQLNTPSDQMYATLNKAISEKFEGSTILYVTSKELKPKNVVTYFKEHCTLPHVEINIADLVDEDFLKKEIDKIKGHVVIIPTSSNLTFLKLISPILTNLKDKTEKNKFTMLGYPEWQNYESLYSFYHSVNAIFHTRYSSINNDSDADDIYNQYVYWFGNKPTPTVPYMHILGYDIANFLIEEMSDKDNQLNTSNHYFEGIQICINLSQSEGMKGYTNTAVYLVNFKPDNTIEKTIIK